MRLSIVTALAMTHVNLGVVIIEIEYYYSNSLMNALLVLQKTHEFIYLYLVLQTSGSMLCSKQFNCKLAVVPGRKDFLFIVPLQLDCNGLCNESY